MIEFLGYGLITLGIVAGFIGIIILAAMVFTSWLDHHDDKRGKRW